MDMLLKIFPVNQRFSKSFMTSLFLTLLFACFVSFFYLTVTADRQESIVRLCLVTGIALLYFLMMKTGYIKRYRSIFFISFSVLFIISFVGHLYDARGHMYLSRANISQLETPFCHIVIPMTIVPAALSKTIIFPAKMSGSYASIGSMVGIWLLTIFTIGRGWCSWVCFYGGLDEGFSKIGKKKRWNIDRLKKMRLLPFAVLSFVVLASFLVQSAVYCEWLCPFKTTTEYAQIVDFKSFIATVIFIGLFVTLVIVLPILTRKRTQCGLFCPFGAFQSFFNKSTLYRVQIDKNKCKDCLKCVSGCPTFSLTKKSLEKGKTEITCTRCGSCIDNCPEGAIDYKIAGVPFTQKDDYFNEKDHSKKWKQYIAGKLNEIFDPRVFLISTAFLFGVIISSRFLTDAILRISNLIMNGTMLH